MLNELRKFAHKEPGRSKYRQEAQKHVAGLTFFPNRIKEYFDAMLSSPPDWPIRYLINAVDIRNAHRMAGEWHKKRLATVAHC
ncbi:hypothetical protein [Pantoea sp. FN0307]|uniref:hypothetical protein n=1 Tax=Pantoea sp. FN0307 TaxID=3418560 RepID=UPI003CF6A9C6